VDEPACNDTHQITVLEAIQTEPGNFAFLSITRAEMDIINDPDFGGMMYKLANHERIAYDAIQMTKSRFSATERADGNFGNAFQHAYWNFLLVKKFMRINKDIVGDPMVDDAVSKARRLTDAHENWRVGDTGNPCGDKAMDLSNNQVGLEFAKQNPKIDYDKAAEALEKMARQGLLSTNPH
jgi:hypothetical protein